MWNKVVEKAIDVEVKPSLQPPFRTRKIDSKCPRGYRLSVKKDKNNTNRKYRNRDKDKAKSYNPLC